MPKLQIQVSERLMEFVVDGPALIGRTDECEVLIADNEVSRKHCRIERAEDRNWVLIDLGSRNGTLVNGAPVVRHVLRSGDIMRVGRAQIAFMEQETGGAEGVMDARSTPMMQESPDENPDGARPQSAQHPAPPYQTGDPEIDEMLSELAPDPADYLGNITTQPASMPSSAAPIENHAGAARAPASNSARRHSWDQLLHTKSSQSSRKSTPKKPKTKTARLFSVGRLKRHFAKINASHNQRFAVIAATAIIALLIVIYAFYTTLFAGPKVATSAPAHVSARAHRLSDD